MDMNVQFCESSASLRNRAVSSSGSIPNSFGVLPFHGFSVEEFFRGRSGNSLHFFTFRLRSEPKWNTKSSLGRKRKTPRAMESWQDAKTFTTVLNNVFKPKNALLLKVVSSSRTSRKFQCYWCTHFQYVRLIYSKRNQCRTLKRRGFPFEIPNVHKK